MAIIRIVGIILLILGGLSGIALFFRAVTGNLSADDTSTGTLWGLFIIGMIAGLIIVAVTG
ncbi:MAG: hypothetical protein IH950_02800 [Bacteroidetes bacterium]|nr:hypothetical protein [Bacteroidota bacterium]